MTVLEKLNFALLCIGHKHPASDLQGMKSNFISEKHHVLSPDEYESLIRKLKELKYIDDENKITYEGEVKLQEIKKEERINWTTLAVIFGGVAGGSYYSLELLLKIGKLFLFLSQTFYH